jgi:hypothetical protein
MADGQNPEKDRNLNNGEYDSTPLDLDGDGTPDINSSATRSSVISSFQRIVNPGRRFNNIYNKSWRSN